MTWFAVLKRFFRQRKLRQHARRELLMLFESEGNLHGTSLKMHHRGRCDIVELEGDEELKAFVFQILRHPRPHPFSKQHHLVAERWRYDLHTKTLERAGSLNLSRLKGGDGEPPGSFP